MRKLTPFAVLILAAVSLSETANPQSVPSATGSRVSKEQAQQALDFHNKIRKQVGSPPLDWSADLAKYAQEWAEHAAAHGCGPLHRPNSGKWARLYGENSFAASDSSSTALQASQSWFGEKKNYKHEALTMGNVEGAGHYSQMVWRASAKLGMGQAVCKNGGKVIIANYDPAGNFLGQVAY